MLCCALHVAFASTSFAQSIPLAPGLTQLPERMWQQESETASPGIAVGAQASDLGRLPEVDRNEFFAGQPDWWLIEDPQIVHSQSVSAATLVTDAERISALEKQVAELSKRTAEAKPASDNNVGGSSPGASTEKWNVKVGGHIQMDYINCLETDSPPIPAPNYFEFRRLRLTAEGTGYGVYDFRLQMTLEPPTLGTSVAAVPDIGTPIGTPLVKDAYFSLRDVPLLGRWRIGNFFVPFGLEQVTNDTFNTFLERSIPTEGVFCASRQVGMAQYHVTDDENLTWTTGVFLDGNGDLEFLKKRLDDNQGLRASGRLTWLPCYDESSNGRYLVHTGMGVLYTKDHDERVRFAARPQIHEGPRLIDSGVLNADQYTTGNVELAVVWGSFAVQTEAFVCDVHMLSGADVSIGGAYAHASYFLTGENRVYERFGQHGAQFARNVPFTNVFAVPGAIGFGAWEVKGRWSYLDLDPLNRGQYNDFTFGFNWYWSDRTRVMVDLIHPMTTSQTTFGSSDSTILGMRFDVNW